MSPVCPCLSRMNDMAETGEYLSLKVGNGAISSTAPHASTNTNGTAPHRKKRSSKKCKRCGRSVQNLSRHLEEVHGMSKTKRKLHTYMTGEKKTPKRRLKFCPLSPCKKANTPFFQLHKHLQTSVHNLKSKTPAYLNALAIAQRATVASVISYLGRRNKRRFESQTDATKGKVDGESEPEAEKRLCHKDDIAHESKCNWSPEENSESSDENYEELGQRAQRKRRKRRRKAERQTYKSAKYNRIEASLPLDSHDEYNTLTRKVCKKQDENRVKRGEQKKTQTKQRNHASVSSDKENNRLTSRVLEGGKNGDGMKSSDEEELQSDEEFDVVEEDGGGDRANHKQNKHFELSHGDNAVEVYDSEDDCKADPDYVYEVESYSSASNQSEKSSDSSSLTEECEKLLSELVEVIGERKIEKGSFLDLEDDWRREVKKFKDKKLLQGHVFKTPVEAAEQLERFCEDKDDNQNIDEELRGVFEGDQSDNDDALDTDWVPSDVEADLPNSPERKPEIKEERSEQDKFLTQFYSWLLEVDGGYRSDKIARQYRSQVQSVVNRLAATERNTANNEAKKSPVSLLLIPGKDGDTFLKTWLSYAVNSYQPGTVRSYLMSLRLFYKFLIQEHKNISSVTPETLNARRDLMSSWSAAQKKKVAKRKLEKRDEDYKKLLSSKNLFKICHGNQRVNAVKQLASSSAQTLGGQQVTKVLSDVSYCEVRDWLLTRLIVDNSGRSGVAANLKITEFKEAVYYPGNEEDPARYRVLVKDHKTAVVYGAAVVWIYDDLHRLIDMFLRTVRNVIGTLAPHVEQVFVSSNGLPLTSSQVSTCVWRTFQREGVQTKGRVSATVVRKSLATGMHVHLPEEKDHLAALALHKSRTQADYYRVHDKVNEADLGRRAVKKLVSLNTEEIHRQEKPSHRTKEGLKTESSASAQNEMPAQSLIEGEVKTENGAQNEKPVQWTEDEVARLKDVFKQEIETGIINESEVKAKVSKQYFLKTHSLKSIVLKVRRMRSEYNKNVFPPVEQETSNEKVLRFLSSATCQIEENGPTNAPALTTDSSRYWRKFTDEQTSHLLHLTKDLVSGNIIKKELIWQRVKEDARSKELGLITGNEDADEEIKCKQRLTDKVRKEARRMKQEKQRRK